MCQKAQRPYSIRVFVADGEPDGLRLVTKSNWTGLGVVFNRSTFKESCKRKEFDRTGVYVLVGPPSGDSSMPTLYIGETDQIRDRLKLHYSGKQSKDFWTWCVFFVSNDDSLNKAHVKYMEQQLIQVALDAKKCDLDNQKTSTAQSLTEYEQADCDSFIIDMLSIFPLLGLSVFEKTVAQPKAKTLLYCQAPTKGLKSEGYESKQGFVVLAGSSFASSEAKSIHNYISSLRRNLIEKKVVKKEAESFVFAEDYNFDSPSTAAGVVLGRTANGRIEWKNTSGLTLKELQTNDS